MWLIGIFNVHSHITELPAHQSDLFGKGGIGKNNCELGLQPVLKIKASQICSDIQLCQGIEGSFIYA